MVCPSCGETSPDGARLTNHSKVLQQVRDGRTNLAMTRQIVIQGDRGPLPEKGLIGLAQEKRGDSSMQVFFAVIQVQFPTAFMNVVKAGASVIRGIKKAFPIVGVQFR